MTVKTIVVKIVGKDAEQALAELMSNIQYDKLEVKVIILRKARATEE